MENLNENLNNTDEPPSNQFTPLSFYIPKNLENKDIYQNGLSKIIDRLTVKVEKSLEKCYRLWEKFSPKNSLFNLWDFRYSWYQGWQYQPLFYTIYLGKKPLATLPLWFNKKEKIYQWFGGTWPEDNYFFVDDEDFILPLLKIAPKPINLNAIFPQGTLAKWKEIYFVDDSPKYVIFPKKYHQLEDFLMSLKKKHRHHLRYYFKKYADAINKIEFLEGNQSQNINRLYNLSLLDFERRVGDESEYRKKERIKTFEMIYKNQGVYKIFSLYLWAGDYLAAYDIIGRYKNNLYILTGASDIQRFPGLGVFITYVELKKAWEMGVELIDCMQEDYNWKHKYFTSQPMLKFERKH